MAIVVAVMVWLGFVLALHWLGMKLQTHIWNQMLKAPPPDEPSTKHR